MKIARVIYLVMTPAMFVDHGGVRALAGAGENTRLL
jgi:hypothetical protein